MTKPSVIGIDTLCWFDPAKRPPPFDLRLLLMVAGFTSEDAGKTWETYTNIVTAVVSKVGPCDDDDDKAIDDYMAGDKTDFMDYQFCLTNEDGNPMEDWYSDGIVAWAYYPFSLAQAAVDLSRQRQSNQGAS